MGRRGRGTQTTSAPVRDRRGQLVNRRAGFGVNLGGQVQAKASTGPVRPKVLASSGPDVRPRAGYATNVSSAADHATALAVQPGQRCLAAVTNAGGAGPKGTPMRRMAAGLPMQVGRQCDGEDSRGSGRQCPGCKCHR